MPVQSKRYLFIDGAYLREQYTRFAQKWFGGPGEINYATLVDLLTAEKCFYYDCSDEKPRNNEAQQEFEERVAKQRKVFTTISRVPRAHVRYGTLKGASNKRRQKEVDILIAVDMMSHAARKNMEEAILIAGDMDFTPVVESLVDLGLNITVRADKLTVAEELAWAADTFSELTANDYHAWSSKKLQRLHPLPEVVFTEERINGTFLKRGNMGDYECVLFSVPPNHVLFIQGFRDGLSMRVTYEDLEKLELFCELQYAKIHWE